METHAHIVEVFSSRQGEGPHVGEHMTFVRFAGCSFDCAYCDTPQGINHTPPTVRIETPPRSEHFCEEENPLTTHQLSDRLDAFPDDIVSITGGEPLDHTDFLQAWLPTFHRKRRILLETNGIHPSRLATIAPYIHIVSMDLKLPSSTGRAPAWEEHALFLQVAQNAGCETYIKIVLTAATTDDDLHRAIDLIGHGQQHIPVILQPASVTTTFHDIASNERIAAIQALFRGTLPDVRVIPQMHKQWGIL